MVEHRPYVRTQGEDMPKVRDRGRSATPPITLGGNQRLPQLV
jgi:hypothetical protein